MTTVLWLFYSFKPSSTSRLICGFPEKKILLNRRTSDWKFSNVISGFTASGLDFKSQMTLYYKHLSEQKQYCQFSSPVSQFWFLYALGEIGLSVEESLMCSGPQGLCAWCLFFNVFYIWFLSAGD